PGSVVPADPVASAQTVAVHAPSETGAGLVSGKGSLPRAGTTTTGGGPAQSKMGLFVALGIGAVAAIGGAVFFLGHGGAPAAGGGGIAVPASTPTASALPAATPAPTAACPSGMIAIPGGSYFMGSDDGLALEKPAHQVTLQP